MKRLLEIPSSFELHGITYKVRYDVKLSMNSSNIGEARYSEDEIVLQSRLPGVPMTADRLGQVFCHELTHCILREMNHKLRSDENFVELFASILHQAIVSAKGSEV